MHSLSKAAPTRLAATISFIPLIALISLSTLSALSPLSYARILNVPDDFETIQASIDAAEDGDSIIVAAGEYPENVNFGGKSVRLISPGEAIIRGGGHGPCVRFVSGEDRESWLVGFTLTDGVATGDGYGGGILIERSSPYIARNVIFDNIAEQGGGGIAVSFDGCNPLIEYNLIYSNITQGAGGGVSFYQCAGVLRNNTINANVAAQGGSGVNIPFTDGVVVVNNIITRNSNGGVAGWQVQNTAIAYNNVWSNAGAAYNNVEAGEGSIEEDPHFVNGGNDFHLTADSPCIDAGDPDSPPDPDGTRVDMGAFYFDQRGEAPHIIDYIPEEQELSLGQGDTLSFSVTAEDAEGDSIRYLWLFDEDTVSVDIMLTIVFADIGDVIVQCHISDGHSFGSIAWRVEVQSLSVPSCILHSSFFILHSAFPNPFNSSTTITFSVGQVSQPVLLTIHDLSGRLVADLTNSAFRNPHSAIGKVVWDAGGLPDGIYLIRLESKNKSETMKTILIK